LYKNKTDKLQKSTSGISGVVINVITVSKMLDMAMRSDLFISFLYVFAN
jgi:hypothetical protein